MFSRPTSAPRRAFTLVELLTVVAIIGILAAILIPVVGKVRASARAVKCTANLRQIGVAMQLHATEYRGMLPSASGTQLTGDSAGWANTLGRYLTSQSSTVVNSSVTDETTREDSVFTCPSGRPAEEKALVAIADTPGGYGVYYGAWPTIKQISQTITKNDGSGTVTKNFASLLRVIKPTRTILAMDSPMSGNFGSVDSNLRQAFDLRHSARLNVLWASGSVTTLTTDDMVASRSTGSPYYVDYWLAGN